MSYNNIIIKITRRKTGKKDKRPDKRPARARYWLKRQLEKNKIRNLIKYCHMTKEQASKFWKFGSSKNGLGKRISRVPDNFLRYS